MKSVVILITSIFCMFVAIPLTTYHGYEYYKNRKYVEFKKRYATITIYEIIFAVFKFLLDAIAMFIIWFNQNAIATEIHGKTPDTLITVANILGDCFIFCQTMRFFLLSFSINLSNVLSHSNEWRQIINPEDTTYTTKMGWYLTKKHKYGSMKWVAKAFSPLFLFVICTDILNGSVGDYILHGSETTLSIIDIVNSSFGIIIYIPMFCLYFTIPKFKDNFFISEELKW
eukprot:444684_1